MMVYFKPKLEYHEHSRGEFRGSTENPCQFNDINELRGLVIGVCDVAWALCYVECGCCGLDFII